MASAPPATHQCYSEDSDTPPETYDLIHRGRAIQLPPCSLSNDYYSRVVVSVAIMFNLALAHHLFALEQAPGSSKSETMLRKVLKFYECCSFIILRAQHHAKTPKGSLLLMATINSSGHIHIILGEEEHASTCFRNLFSTLLPDVPPGVLPPWWPRRRGARGRGPLLRSSFELRLNIWCVTVLAALLLLPK
jgi:hypothetical protein